MPIMSEACFKVLFLIKHRHIHVGPMLRMVVDSSISMMSVQLWMGSGVAVEAYP